MSERAERIQEESTPRRILIADDSAVSRRLASTLLERAGYQTDLAEDGFQAIQAVHEYWPDLIVLDVMMPLINGYQVCRLLKSDPVTKNIPVIMLTARAQRTDRYWGLSTGADAYITKGHELDDLVKRVQEALEQAPPRPSSNRAAGPQPTTPFDILARANDLLDRQLYEATIMNEITQLASPIRDYRTTVRAAVQKFSRVLEFDAAGLLLEADDEIALHIVPFCRWSPARLASLEAEMLRQAGIPEESAAQIRRYVDYAAMEEGAELLEESSEQDADFAYTHAVLIRRGEQGVGGAVVLAGNHQLLVGPEDEVALHRLVAQAAVVIDNARLYEQIRNMATLDGLTGAFNHSHFHELLDQELVRGQRYRRPFSLLMLDIDHFKRVNDTFGHQTGDKALQAVVARCKEELRETDLLGRYGGEEFVILLPETGLTRAKTVAERLRESIAEITLTVEGDTLNMTMSIGVTAWPDCGKDDVGSIINKADTALYRAKHEGRNRVATEL